MKKYIIAFYTLITFCCYGMDEMTDFSPNIETPIVESLAVEAEIQPLANSSTSQEELSQTIPSQENTAYGYEAPTYIENLDTFNQLIRTNKSPLCIVITAPLDDQTAQIIYMLKKEFEPEIQFIRLDTCRDASIVQTITQKAPAFFFMYNGKELLTSIQEPISQNNLRNQLETFKQMASKDKEQADLRHKKFQEKIIENKRDAVLIFTASWCAPCNEMKPFIEELKDTHKDSIKFKRYFYDKDSELSDIFNIHSLPTFVFMRDGIEIYRFKGATDKESFEQALSIFTSETPLSRAELDALVAKGAHSMRGYFTIDFEETSTTDKTDIPANVACSKTSCEIQ